MTLYTWCRDNNTYIWFCTLSSLKINSHIIALLTHQPSISCRPHSKYLSHFWPDCSIHSYKFHIMCFELFVHRNNLKIPVGQDLFSTLGTDPNPVRSGLYEGSPCSYVVCEMARHVNLFRGRPFSNKFWEIHSGEFKISLPEWNIPRFQKKISASISTIQEQAALDEMADVREVG